MLEGVKMDRKPTVIMEWNNWKGEKFDDKSFYESTSILGVFIESFLPNRGRLRQPHHFFMIEDSLAMSAFNFTGLLQKYNNKNKQQTKEK